MAETYFTGPLVVGPRQFQKGTDAPNQGFVAVHQMGTLGAAQTTAATTLYNKGFLPGRIGPGTGLGTAQVTLPAGAYGISIMVDITTAFAGGTAGTAPTMAIGISGTNYATGIVMDTAGRVSYTFSSAQLNLYNNIGAGTADAPIVTTFSFTSGSATTAGAANVLFAYVPSFASMTTPVFS